MLYLNNDVTPRDSPTGNYISKIIELIEEIIVDIKIFLKFAEAFIYRTRRSGRYAPILLAPAEGWGPFGPLGALRALMGAFGHQ